MRVTSFGVLGLREMTVLSLKAEAEEHRIPRVRDGNLGLGWKGNEVEQGGFRRMGRGRWWLTLTTD